MEMHALCTEAWQISPCVFIIPLSCRNILTCLIGKHIYNDTFLLQTSVLIGYQTPVSRYNMVALKEKEKCYELEGPGLHCWLYQSCVLADILLHLSEYHLPHPLLSSPKALLPNSFRSNIISDCFLNQNIFKICLPPFLPLLFMVKQLSWALGTIQWMAPSKKKKKKNCE